MSMGRRKTISTDLPPRMTRKTWTDRRGREHEAFYYLHARDDQGRQRMEPLGTERALALRKWAEIEAKVPPIESGLLKPIFERYEREIVPRKAVRTQRDDLAMLKMLGETFGQMSIETILPRHIRQYLDKRTAKVRGNREMALLSHVWNKAREWGYTDRANPVQGIEKNRETGRDIYVSDTDFNLVHKHCPVVLQDLLDLAYLTGQRPGDVMRYRWDMVRDGALWIQQTKTKAKLQIIIEGKLATVIERIRTRGGVKGLFLLTDPKGQPLKPFGFARKAFDDARNNAEKEAKEQGIAFHRWQLRDLRPKAASDMDNMAQARKLLGHTTENMTAHYVRQRVGERVKPVK